LNHRKLLAIAAALGALGVASPAYAQSDPTSVTITGGTLAYTTPLTAGNFPNVTLDGTQKVVTANVNPYVVTDSRGGAAGWNLTVEATQFTSASSATLPQGSLQMALPPLPTKNVLDNPLGLPPTVQPTLNAIDGGSAQKVVSAAAAPLVGAGAWTFTPLPSALTLSVPGVVTPGTYTSTITTTLSSGP
jgi:WxL domain surface cell wall-binding